MATDKRYTSLKEFYPFYLSEHKDPTCRKLHFTGTALLFVILIWAVATQTWWGLLLIPVVGYGFAWVGHFFYEKNKPATFQYPAYSLASDFIMFRDLLIGKESFNPQKDQSESRHPS
ncbi:MAG: DUF962 domain-containing protein [Cyclobacteriaceae bacterium]